jgi:hypothetical protein
MWFFDDEPWQYRVLDRLPEGVDRAQLDRARMLSPTQRLDAAIALMEVGEALREAVIRARPGR